MGDRASPSSSPPASSCARRSISTPTMPASWWSAWRRRPTIRCSFTSTATSCAIARSPPPTATTSRGGPPWSWPTWPSPSGWPWSIPSSTIASPALREELVTHHPRPPPRRRAGRRVEFQRAFHFQQSRMVPVPLGPRATTLAEFRQGLAVVDASAIYLHMVEARARLGRRGGDFAAWLRGALDLPGAGRPDRAHRPLPDHARAGARSAPRPRRPGPGGEAGARSTPVSAIDAYRAVAPPERGGRHPEAGRAGPRPALPAPERRPTGRWPRRDPARGDSASQRPGRGDRTGRSRAATPPTSPPSRRCRPPCRAPSAS